jgi:hypothetical protein
LALKLSLNRWVLSPTSRRISWGSGKDFLFAEPFCFSPSEESVLGRDWGDAKLFFVENLHLFPFPNVSMKLKHLQKPEI